MEKHTAFLAFQYCEQNCQHIVCGWCKTGRFSMGKTFKLLKLGKLLLTMQRSRRMKSGILELRLHWTLIILVVQISVFSSVLDNDFCQDILSHLPKVSI